MKLGKLEPGDWLIYRKTKHSRSPGPRAQNVIPSPHGEDYGYYVDKFWILTEVTEDGRLRLRTRRGKEYVLDSDDPNLRRARWWERLMYRQRFKDVERGVQLAQERKDSSAEPNAQTS